jgi:ribosomal protein S18 acetylase RimI-like enzyme
MPYLYRICLKTANAGKDASGQFLDEALPGHYYAAPYLVYDRQLCFIAEEGSQPCGYIVAASHSPTFYDWMNTEWLPPLRKQRPLPPPSGLTDMERRFIALLHRNPAENPPPYIEEYPAHLHINLMDGHQGKGLGRALMDALFSALNRGGVSGVHLGVARSNTGAVFFYTALGFSLLDETPDTFFMGKKL